MSSDSDSDSDEDFLRGDPSDITLRLTKRLFGIPDATPIQDPDELLRSLVFTTPGLASRQVCQYQFKRNDIAWICKDCQSDETCVLCNACYNDSDHEGHEVYYYHSQAGGCCDCGDRDAWKPAGFCTKHGHTHSDPLSMVPSALRQTATALLRTVVSELAAYVGYYSALFEAVPLAQTLADGETWRVDLQQDDLHTPVKMATDIAKVFKEANGTSFAIEEANGKALATLVKLEGVATIWDGDDAETADKVLHRLRIQGYRVALVPAQAMRRRQALLACCAWLFQLATLSDASCRMVCQALETCPTPPATQNSNSNASHSHSSSPFYNHLEHILLYGQALDKVTKLLLYLPQTGILQFYRYNPP